MQLDPIRISQHLNAAAQAVLVEVVAQTASTNSDLFARIADLNQPVVRVAEHQTAGRGRAGREWVSVPGGMLTFSLAWPMSGNLSGLPLALGVAVAETLCALDVHVQLKWPNDILREGKKLAGILVESAKAENGQAWIVAGLGLNLLTPTDMEAQLGRGVADAPWLARMDASLLLAQLVNAWVNALQQFEQTGFSSFVPRWNALHAYAGQAVKIIDAGQIQASGQALGVDTQGCLLLQTETGVHSVIAGDVSLRLI